MALAGRCRGARRPAALQPAVPALRRRAGAPARAGPRAAGRATRSRARARRAAPAPRRWPTAINELAAPARRAARRHGAAGARGQPRDRAGAQPPRGADGRADAERRGLQPRRPHPALQQPRAAAVPRAVERAGAGRRRRADRPGPLDLRRVRPPAGRARAGERPAAPAARRGQPVGAVRHHHAGGQLLRVQMAPVRARRARRRRRDGRRSAASC